MDAQYEKDQKAGSTTLAVQKLEDRITPRLSSNHNEPMLTTQKLEDRTTPRLSVNHNESLLVEL